MPLAFLTLFTGLTLSAVAIYYSVIGLTAIFAAAFWPIIVMGVTLEVAKLVSAWWLKSNWSQAPALLKSYMLVAVIILMIITSMGIFGFLSKAHTDQSLVGGDVQARVLLFDEKIKIERENIANAQSLIKQMDSAVTGVIATGDQEIKLKDGSTQIRSAAERSLQIRRSQAKDRAALTKQIEEAQARIVKLQEEAAPIRAEIRKVEAEVGPIKYIAKLIYGDNPDTNILEKAVTWVIIIIVLVFDPLAVLLLLASQMSFQWARQQKEEERKNELVQEDPTTEKTGEESTTSESDDRAVDAGSGKEQPEDTTVAERDPADEANEKIAEIQQEVDVDLVLANAESILKEEEKSALDQWNEMIAEAEKEAHDESSKIAKQKWKAEHPNETIKRFEKLHDRGVIAELPWEANKEELIKEEETTPETVAKSYQIIPELQETIDSRLKPDLTEVVENEESKKKTTYIVKEQDQQIRKEKQ